MSKQFKFDMAKWAKAANVKAVTFAREFTQDIAKEVVQNTPVMTGFLRGSWYASINNSSKFEAGRSDKSGSTSVAKMTLTINGAKSGDILYVLNGASYAKYVEFGTSRMAPRAYVRGTLSQANAIAAKTATRIKAMK